MKNKNETFSNPFNEKEFIEQNETHNSLNRRSFMKQSLAASAGVVASPNLIAPSFQKTTTKSVIK